MKKRPICFVFGTRPEIIKLSPVIFACKAARMQYLLIHTNQHYSENMDSAFFHELRLPTPKYNLQIRETKQGKMVGTMLSSLESVLEKEQPAVVCVQGDTNSVLAGALAAAKLQIPIVHIEAGLRSYDRSMPEEINRILTDHLSAYLCCPTQKQKNILLSEGIDKSKAIVTGNTIVDAVKRNVSLAEKDRRFHFYKNEPYILLTLHRPSNVDSKIALKNMMLSVLEVSKTLGYPVYFPAHPRTQKKLEEYRIKIDSRHIILREPVGYLEMLMMEKYAQLILTDSGGVQEEGCILRVPCVTLRENTERPETVEVGSNIVAGIKQAKIVAASKKMIRKKRSWVSPFGDGKSAQKILQILKKVVI